MASTSWARICDLPDEVLLSIFSFLPVADLARCAATCERWHRIVTGFTALWRGKVYRSERSPTESAETRAVLHALPTFQEVKIESVNGFVISVSYPRLKLQVRYIRGMNDFPRLRCDSLLTRLDTAGDILTNQSTVDLERLQQLRIQQMGYPNFWGRCIYSGDYVIHMALVLCPNLRHLSICTDFLSVEYLAMMQGLGRLKTLEIECPGVRKLSFLRHCSCALEELQLVRCTGLPSWEFVQLWQLRNLRKLWLRHCRFMVVHLAAAVVALSNLESLQLDTCSSIGDLTFLQHCGQLRELRITTTSMPDLVRAEEQLLQLHELQVPSDPHAHWVPAVAVAVTAGDLSAALSRLADLGLATSCLAHLGALRRCSQLRNICCEFVRGPDRPEWLNVRVRITLTRSSQS